MVPRSYPAKKYHVGKNFDYEVRYQPWFGPLSKAQKALDGINISDVSPKEFLEFFGEEYPAYYQTLTFVQFYIFPGRKSRRLKNGADYRIAVLYLGPDPEARQKVFDAREIITQVTGWYPLIMGARANPIISRRNLTLYEKRDLDELEKINIGKLQRIRSVAFNKDSGPGGNAFILQGEKGSFLLDTGFNFPNSIPNDLQATLLTHFHADHSGGVWDVLDTGQPLFVTEPTLRYLFDRRSKDPKKRKLLLNNALVIERSYNDLNKNPHIQVFPVFHVPGAVGYSIKDGQGNCLIYPGDFCLKNGFLDYSEQLWQTIQQLRSKNTWVLVDSTMVSRENEAISDEDTPEDILKEVYADLSRRNAIFTSRSVETLVYEYILAFLGTRTLKINGKPIKLVVCRPLHRLCETIFGPMIFRKYHQIDPFLKSEVGKNATNFIESHRVYPLESLRQIPQDETVIIFATTGDMDYSKDVQNRLRGSNVILAGTVAFRSDEVPHVLEDAMPRSIIRVSSPDWNFHSKEEDLAKFVWQLTQEEIHVLLFHSSFSNMRKFITRHSLNKDYVHLIDEQGLRISR